MGLGICEGKLSTTSLGFSEGPYYSDSRFTSLTGARRLASQSTGRGKKKRTPLNTSCAYAPSSCDRMRGRLSSGQLCHATGCGTRPTRVVQSELQDSATDPGA